MKLSDFHYDLPDELIAQFPPAKRGDSRLLCLDGNTGKISDQHFSSFIELLQPGDLLVFNDTRVMPARMYGKKETGGKVEILVERLLSETRALAHIRSSKSPKADSYILLDGGQKLKVIGRQQSLFEIDSLGEPLLSLMSETGHMPLPPYITRADEHEDESRYQTVYAKKTGAVAAPTAGLHFTEEMLAQISQKGIDTAYVTLHVGAGTFQPVRVENLDEHDMHREFVELGQDVVDAVSAARQRGGRVIAIGTTTVRSLESAAEKTGRLERFSGDTQLFIRPGFQFNVVDAMLTNFHLPESTLLMLVSAFAGYENILHAYQHAVEQRYRFFSYGDAMWLTRRDFDRQKKGAAGEPRQVPPKEDGGCAE